MIKMNFSAVFLLAVFAIPFVAGKDIPSDVKSDGGLKPNSLAFLGSVEGKSYYAENTTMTWDEAFEYCNSANMTLATITTVAQRTFLQNRNSVLFSRYHWIGARESRKATELSWVVNNEDLSSEVFPRLYNQAQIQICGSIDVLLEMGYLDMSFALCNTLKKVLCEN